MATTILLIRHGETDWNASGRWQGQSDIPLNNKGREQAALLADRLKSWPIIALYSSDLLRAKQTADALGDALGLKPKLDSSWRERNGGQFEGMTADELRGNAEFHKLRREKDWAPPDGESNVQVAARTQQAFDKIIQQHEGEMVAVVSHGGAIITMLSLILGFTPGDRAPIWVSGNTGFSIVEVGNRGSFLVRMNDTVHLDLD